MFKLQAYPVIMVEQERVRRELLGKLSPISYRISCGKEREGRLRKGEVALRHLELVGEISVAVLVTIESYKYSISCLLPSHRLSTYC